MSYQKSFKLVTYKHPIEIRNKTKIALLRKMKAMFAWMSLLAALANLFAVASGQPDPLPPPLPAILKTSVAGVSFCLFCINFPNLLPG